MPAASPAPMTAEEFLAIPAREGERLELIEGELIVMEGALLQHQLALGNLYGLLWTWSRTEPDRGLVALEVDTQLDRHNVLLPDLQWYAPGRELDATRRPQPLGDLVAEVRSPSTWARDVGIKRDLYERHGAGELWLVDPAARSVLVFARTTPDAPRFDTVTERTADESLTSALLPGFAVDVAAIFG
ncbi:MAG: Uma2 family endonuclease [Solirubrobacteraceae bacterium]|nr:Uma2 family endonuclease [Solirubrobacteraceae bacterium]